MRSDQLKVWKKRTNSFGKNIKENNPFSKKSYLTQKVRIPEDNSKEVIVIENLPITLRKEMR